MTNEEVILVDTSDVPTGTMEKMEAHRKGVLHRAFSVFILNDRNEMLLHRRAVEKYHSGGLWTNACCSHPRPGEEVHDAANRRLMEEMGLSCVLVKYFDFLYRVELDNNLIEHEFDHVFVGYSNNNPTVDPSEVSEWKWIKREDLRKEIADNPQQFTSWFLIAFPLFDNYLKN